MRNDWKKMDWRDPFLLEEQLSEEHRMVRDSAKQYAEESLQPRVVQAYREEYTDKKIFQEMGELGLLGSTLQGYGCPGVDYVSYGLIAREIERVDSGYRSMLSVQSSLVMFPIYAFGSTQQKDKYLPDLASGRKIGCFGLTEPDAGSDPASMRTKSEKVIGGWVLKGTKMWISNSPIADIFIVWAKDDQDTVRGFILEKGMEGLSAPSIKGKLALRTSVTGEIVMDKVFVSEDQILANAEGFKAPFSCLNNARFGIAWGALGAAEACWHAARSYTMERKQFGKVLAANQLVQFKLAEMQTEINLGLQGCLRASELMDSGDISPELISLLKRNSCRKALAVARMARDMHGANGISDEYSIMRHMNNLEVVNTYEGTEDVHALILGRSQTGMSTF